MTVTDSKEPEITLNAVPDDPTLATAVGVVTQDVKPGGGKQEQAAGGAPSGPPIPAGHSRFYCNKCRTVSIAPARFVSFQTQGPGRSGPGGRFARLRWPHLSLALLIRTLPSSPPTAVRPARRRDYVEVRELPHVQFDHAGGVRVVQHSVSRADGDEPGSCGNQNEYRGKIVWCV